MLSELAIIREGHFSETGGEPTLRITGDLARNEKSHFGKATAFLDEVLY